MRSKFAKSLVLPDHLREELAKPFGLVIQEAELKEHLTEQDTIFAVGDVTVLVLLKNGYSPKISIYDLKTKRKDADTAILKSFFKNTVKIKNPAGKITVELWSTIKSAVESDRNTAIEVEGEEDLASLVCIYFAPENSMVLYGIPDKGIALIQVNEQIKKQVENILEKMEK